MAWRATMALAAALVGSSAAHAVTTVVSAVLDHEYQPGPADRNPTFATDYLTPAFPFNIGDTLDVTLTFPGGAAQNLGFLPSDVRFTVFGGGGYTSTIYQSTATFTFIGAVGAVNATNGPATSFAERNPAVDFTGVRQQQRGPLTFTGLHVVITLDSAVIPYGPPVVPPATFSAFEVGFTNDVPEPAAWTMLIAGFALTGAMARRHRAVRNRFPSFRTMC